ncbi:MAG: (2Fe-2S)-binding protein [Spirochaetia bacterium]|jgi:carbon-monoxide dehydrogenase small subunit
MSAHRDVVLEVNGNRHALRVDPGATLLEVLRAELGLRGTKENCLEGECGACTVLVDGKAVNSCLMLAVRAEGKKITTIEGLARGGELHPVQRAFVEEGAVQCGYCTPGFIMSAVDLLESNPDPTDDEVDQGLAGNICRCTGYTRIRRAVHAAIRHGGEPA